MAKHKPAAYASRDNPLFMELDGRTFRLWVEATHPSQAGDAEPVPLAWTVEVDGVRRRGWEAHVDESFGEIRTRLIDWWDDAKREGGR